MKSVDTKILSKHIELVKIFFQANNFHDARVVIYSDLENYGTQEMIRVFYSDEDEGDIVMMAIRHAGIPNMLDDYLMKCGVNVYDLHAVKILNMKDAMEIALSTK